MEYLGAGYAVDVALPDIEAPNTPLSGHETFGVDGTERDAIVNGIGHVPR